MTSGPLFIQLLGPSALTAIAVFVSLLPLNFFITKKRNHRQVWQLEEGRKWVASLQVSGPALVQGRREVQGRGGSLWWLQRRNIPDFLSSPLFFALVPGRANEAEGLSGAAHQLHPQKCEDGQVPRLGGSLSGQSPAHPGPGAGCLEDLQPPLLRVSGVLPSVHVFGDVSLVPLQSKDWGRECWGCRMRAPHIGSRGHHHTE